MDKVVFETPGLLDLRAITTFGINSKPHSPSPIGFFGTGLKYAIAVLMREGCKVEIYRGRKKSTFRTSTETFRQKEFSFIEMTSPRGRMPFTTELGKTWKLWQAFRELYSNTIDENGQVNVYHQNYSLDIEDNKTYIVVTGDAFCAEYYNKAANFLEDGLRQPVDKEILQCIDRPSKYIYYRGMRILDLTKPSVLTYNILQHIELTEDRTAKYPWYLETIIMNYLITTKDEYIINKAMKAPEDTYEHKLDFRDLSGIPGKVFQDILQTRYYGCGYNHSAIDFAREHSDEHKQLESKKPYLVKLTDAIKEEKWDKVLGLIQNNKIEFCKLLETMEGYVYDTRSNTEAEEGFYGQESNDNYDGIMSC